MWQLAKIVGHYLKKSIDAGQMFAISMLLGRIYGKVLGPPNFAQLPTCSTSSWGILPFREQYKQCKLVRMTPFMNMIRGVMPFITMQTVNNILTIMYVGTDPVIPLNILENLRDGTTHKLHKMMSH